MSSSVNKYPIINNEHDHQENLCIESRNHRTRIFNNYNKIREGPVFADVML